MDSPNFKNIAKILVYTLNVERDCIFCKIKTIVTVQIPHFSLGNNVRAVFHHRGGGRGGKGEGAFFYFLPIRNCSDAPFSLGNDVRAVFHHRGGGRGGKRGGGLFLFPSNIPM
jgi:hypothetical protein